MVNVVKGLFGPRMRAGKGELDCIVHFSHGSLKYAVNSRIVDVAGVNQHLAKSRDRVACDGRLIFDGVQIHVNGFVRGELGTYRRNYYGVAMGAEAVKLCL